MTFSRLCHATTAALSTATACILVLFVLLIGGALTLALRYEPLTDGFNFAISVFTAALAILLLYEGDRDTKATHAKLDELIRSSDARNELIGIEREDRT